MLNSWIQCFLEVREQGVKCTYFKGSVALCMFKASLNTNDDDFMCCMSAPSSIEMFMPASGCLTNKNSV